MRIILIALFSLLFTANLKAQDNYSVRAEVQDGTIMVKLVHTSVSILNAKDSTLVKHTRAAVGGGFSIDKLRAGKFILLVTYPGYADYVEHFTLDSANRHRNLGSLNMILKENLLKDVIIKGEAIAIKIKGDTTEFNAAAYAIEPNSKVEDLLKQLPGIQIDKDGKITAQGKTVEKVLVDGEEFFGDDPTLVTKNLRGDMVDKVQLFDKKSDQATFTGIDDGQKTKTLNIKLKEGKKRGYFGKADGGLATDEFFQGQAMANVFRDKKKFSAYGTIGNTGRTGLHFRDNQYGGSNGVEISADGGIMIMGGGDDFDSFNGQYNGQGIPSAKTGGLHFDSKWNGDKESINTNFMIGSIGVSGSRNNLNQNNLPTGVLFNTSGQTFDNTAFRQKLDIAYDLKIDSGSTLKLKVDGTLKNSQTGNVFDATSTRGNNVLLNSSRRSLTNEGTQQLLNASVLWNKKLKKTGRTLSFSLKNTYNNNETSGFLNSVNNFYNSQGNPDSVQTIDQYKTNITVNSVLNTNLTYTEPITKELSLAVNYGLVINKNDADRKSFNSSVTGEYDVPDAAFSNDFSLRQRTNQAGAIFNYKKDKTVLNFGSRASAVNLKQLDQNTGDEYLSEFMNLSPLASFEYKLAKQKNIRISYNGNTTQPNFSQLQPVRNNDDPLNIMTGNPDLKQSFTNRFSMGYDSHKVLSEQYIYITASYNFTSSAIVNSLVTDSAGKSIYQSVNLSGKTPGYFYLYSNMSRKVGRDGLRLGLNVDVKGDRYYNYINNILNSTNSYRFSGGFSMNKYVAKKYNVSLNVSPSYTMGQSSLQKLINNNGWGFNTNANFSVTLPAKVEISSSANHEYKEKTQSFNEDFSRIIWNSTITKKFNKAENLALSVSGNDLLNQNIGFSRSANSNFITQSSYTTIKRYFMFTLSYDFNKMGVGAAAK